MSKPPVQVHKYCTPTANNRECPYSVGIMNLTDMEARLIEKFAIEVRSRAPVEVGPLGSPLTATEQRNIEDLRARRRQPPAPFDATDQSYSDLVREEEANKRSRVWQGGASWGDLNATDDVLQRRAFLDGNFDPITDLPYGVTVDTPNTEPKNRNRFSELELPDEPQAEQIPEGKASPTRTSGAA